MMGLKNTIALLSKYGIYSFYPYYIICIEIFIPYIGELSDCLSNKATFKSSPKEDLGWRRVFLEKF